MTCGPGQQSKGTGAPAPRAPRAPTPARTASNQHVEHERAKQGGGWSAAEGGKPFDVMAGAAHRDSRLNFVIEQQHGVRTLETVAKKKNSTQTG